MSDEIKPKEKTFEIPMVPFFGLDLARELGSLEAQQRQTGTDILEMKRDLKTLGAKIDAVEAKLTEKIEATDSRVDKCLVAINRLDERTRNLESKFNLSIGLTGAVLAAVVAGIILQYFSK